MTKVTTTPKLSLFIYENDHAVFDWLYKKYWRPLINQCYYYFRDYSIAEEIVQQLFVDIFRKNILIKEVANIENYLKKAVKNRMVNYTAGDKRYRYHLKQFGSSNKIEYNPIDNDMDIQARQQQIHFYLSKLDEPCRTVFILNREEQLTIKEIAEKLRRPKDTVTKQLSRAVRYLYKCIYQTAINN